MGASYRRGVCAVAAAIPRVAGEPVDDPRHLLLEPAGHVDVEQADGLVGVVAVVVHHARRDPHETARAGIDVLAVEDEGRRAREHVEHVVVGVVAVLARPARARFQPPLGDRVPIISLRAVGLEHGAHRAAGVVPPGAVAEHDHSGRGFHTPIVARRRTFPTPSRRITAASIGTLGTDQAGRDVHVRVAPASGEDSCRHLTQIFPRSAHNRQVAVAEVAAPSARNERARRERAARVAAERRYPVRRRLAFRWRRGRARRSDDAPTPR